MPPARAPRGNFALLRGYLERIKLWPAWECAYDSCAREIMDILILPAFCHGEFSRGILNLGTMRCAAGSPAAAAPTLAALTSFAGGDGFGYSTRQQ